jgi:ArsR family transcriptional regulator, arsenate/arsenite/antimonite-responsive transcriptional repressor
VKYRIDNHLVSAAYLTHATRLHKALGHPARLRILAMLRGGELCACQITAVLGLAPSTVSQHLGDLRQAGLVRERKDGRWVHYALADAPEVRAALALSLGELAADPVIAADAVVLARLRRVPLAELCRAHLSLRRLGIIRPGERGARLPRHTRSGRSARSGRTTR